MDQQGGLQGGCLSKETTPVDRWEAFLYGWEARQENTLSTNALNCNMPQMVAEFQNSS